jgi:hypothetical protein
MKRNTGWLLCLFQQGIKVVEATNAEREGPHVQKNAWQAMYKVGWCVRRIRTSMNIGHITVEYPTLLFASKQCIWKKEEIENAVLLGRRQDKHAGLPISATIHKLARPPPVGEHKLFQVRFGHKSPQI